MRTGDADIARREERLREWFTRAADGPRRVVDGLDIGWGGVQRWATSVMPDLGSGRHLDFACGYATFLAELGWRFPRATLVGLNIDFERANATAAPLLREAGVAAELVEGDAREMPFPDASFDSVSCFMGLQDIELAFGEEGVRLALGEAVRVLRSNGSLSLLDEYSFDRSDALLTSLPVAVETRRERSLDVRWDRDVAACAVALYSEGWLEQRRLGGAEGASEEVAEYTRRLRSHAERQLRDRGYFVPFGPVRMVVYCKLAGCGPPSSCPPRAQEPVGR
jgi:SAM-dependent methyltransferase